MRHLVRYLILATTLAGGGAVRAATLRGTVTNASTMKEAANDDVVLLTPSWEGMIESGRAKTDRAGGFFLPVANSEETHVVRVIHQGVTYDSTVPASKSGVKIRVYDVAEKVDGISAVMDVLRLEAIGETLEIKQLVTMRNDSRPPRTLMNNHPFEFHLPPEAHVESGLVQIEEGPPLKRKPVPGMQAGEYDFVFPIRPGDTRFAVIYRLPYSGDALIKPEIRNPLERFVVMLPKAMEFVPEAANIFHPMPDTTPDHVEGADPVTLGRTLAFRIAGTGTLEELHGRRAPVRDDLPSELRKLMDGLKAFQGRRAQVQGDPATQKARPGGGLGPPIEAPDPLEGHRRQILVGLALLLVAGAAWVVRRSGQRYAKTNQSHERKAAGRAPKQLSNTRRNAAPRRSIRASQKLSQ